MRIVLLIFYNTWLVGFFLLSVNALSRWAFSHWDHSVFTGALRAIAFALIWPVSVFSPEGRRALFMRAKQL